MSWVKVAAIVCVLVFVAGVSLAWDANNPPPARENRDAVGAMMLSIALPAMGECYNAGWGWSKMNKRKFWLGFTPFYGMPYLRIRSAIDAKRGATW